MSITDYTFGLRGHDIGPDFSSMCVNAVENHVPSIQFAMAKSIKDVNFDVVGFDETLATNIRGKLRESGLFVPVLGCYINPIDADEERLERSLRRFEAFIRYAQVLDAGVVGTETGVAVRPEHVLYRETYQLFMKNLARLVEVAEQYNVNIGIEPVWCGTVCSPQIMRRVIDDIRSEKVQVILDLSNLLTVDTIPTQRKILDDSFSLFGNRIKTVHLKDFRIMDGKKCFAPPGEGLLDIPYLFEQLFFLREKPQIILDELPLGRYHAALEQLGTMQI